MASSLSELSVESLEQNSKNKKIAKIGLRALLIVIAVFLSLLILLIFSSSLNKKNANKSLLLTYIVVTESMIPTINVNDAVIVVKTKSDSIKIGDIITFSTDNRYGQNFTVTHRIVGKQVGSAGEYLFRTKGDNNVLEDTALVSIDNIYGKVIFRIPKIGYIKSFISSPMGLIFAIVVPIMVLIIYEVLRIRNLVKERENNFA